MKILYVNRNPKSWLGGDVVKMFNFKKAIEKLDVEIDFSYILNEDISDYDLIHSFGLNFEWTYQAYLKAMIHSKKLIVSSIFFPNVGNLSQMVEIVRYASAIIVFSEKEIDAIKEYLGLDDSFDDKFFIIPNGVSDIFYSTNEKRDIDVLCVGSFHPRKQQKLICEACDDLKITPHFIGTQHDQAYYASCANNHVIEYHGRMEQEELVDYYARAKVVVQPSKIDPFPNTLLEGGMAGCNFVLTTTTYVPDSLPGIIMCESKNRQDIREAIEKALNLDLNTKLREYLKNKFSWETAARNTIKLYKKICIKK